VSWPQNLEMTPHVDQDNGFAQRMFAAVGYLNDDYEGGEIYFPEIAESIKPKAGMLVAFHCGQKTPARRAGHERERPALYFPSWFTERKKAIDRSFVDYR
jgi:hypothetical protein